MASRRKIINDPVYGFITIENPLVFEVIAHPYFQRLRRIQQMAFAHLVYPGAVHSRLHHALGAYHLMGNALTELKRKGVEISQEEETAALIAILLHDIGHGPFSHALEHKLIEGVHHEEISLLIIQHLNNQLNGKLELAIKIFCNNYHKPFLHQLISGQLDVDRMDYLSRDSFFTGVSEGVIGYDRIIKMLDVKDGELVVEEKGIYSIEKFLVSRRLMYWQVYLHKTVLCAEQTLVKIIERAKKLIQSGISVHAPSTELDYFLQKTNGININNELDRFCLLDDYDVLGAIKQWTNHQDQVLSELCKMLLNRNLLKVKFYNSPINEDWLKNEINHLSNEMGWTEEQASYLLFTGETSNTTYDPSEEKIKILFKNGEIKDISEVDNALIQHNLARPVKKYYLCHLNGRINQALIH
jgi:uncharacterized protein